MNQYVVEPAALTTVPVVGSDAVFPVRRVYCIGRNYADHALEMGVDPREEPPFFFCKPTDTVVSNAHGPVEVAFPPLTENFHHEVELVVAIGEGGKDIAVEHAARHVWGYAVGVDLTRRDLQLAMRHSGKPWEIGKTFERCAPIGRITPKAAVGALTSGKIALTVDGELRQESDLSKLIWPVDDIIAILSTYFTLAPGDLIFTGTPHGVNRLEAGNALHATFDGLDDLHINIVGAHKELA
ncbi:fumarylacetoacetate hydrolase family protein [Pandoraea anhela]|uniref:5-carboxymethyl-2-hydroxymuconate isomerase n=1 Tax=Pandoraea anhela TaxID=2508295 RepID=A0A5E4X436_9BURK|nr:fumarylacetoacetate hydrolase family protein [Pandoraea anhela]VVE31077.1 5-carboxymethyl-2-hydroxymuconate isomerase [Pandoraea anhela]